MGVLSWFWQNSRRLASPPIKCTKLSFIYFSYSISVISFSLSLSLRCSICAPSLNPSLQTFELSLSLQFKTFICILFHLALRERAYRRYWVSAILALMQIPLCVLGLFLSAPQQGRISNYFRITFSLQSIFDFSLYTRRRDVDHDNLPMWNM